MGGLICVCEGGDEMDMRSFDVFVVCLVVLAAFAIVVLLIPLGVCVMQ